MDRLFALFETRLGTAGIVWTALGIAGFQIPEPDAAGTRRTLLRRFPGAVEAEPPQIVRGAIAKVLSLLAGDRVDLAGLPIDLGGIPDFDRSVYDVLRTLRPGETLTYGEVAARIGDPGAARAVGAALGRNPIPVIVPCHRVLAAGGRSGGFSAPGGAATKLRLLAIEGAVPGGQPDLFGPAA